MSTGSVYNLCEVECGMSICCDTVSSDLFPPSNLLSGSGNLRGFMAEYFIKPPVSLYLHLPFPVVLVEISAETTVGNQSSSVLAVSGSRRYSPRCSPTCSKTENKRRRVELEGPRDQDEDVVYEFLGN